MSCQCRSNVFGRGCQRGRPRSCLSALEKPPDFKVEVQERRVIEDILATLDFKTGPVPAGGVYALEQQQRLFNPVDRPLAQPLATFCSRGGDYDRDRKPDWQVLGGRLAEAVSGAERAKAEAAARRDVAGAIEKYMRGGCQRAKRLSICTR